MGIDGTGGFGPIRTSQPIQVEKLEVNITFRHNAKVCIDFLSIIPILQSANGGGTRDKESLEMILDADGDAFLSLIPFLSNNIRCGRFNLGIRRHGDAVSQVLSTDGRSGLRETGADASRSNPVCGFDDRGMVTTFGYGCLE